MARLTSRSTGKSRFIRYGDTSFCKQVFDVSEAQAEPVVQPNCILDNLWWKAVTMIQRSLSFHLTSVPDHLLM